MALSIRAYDYIHKHRLKFWKVGKSEYRVWQWPESGPCVVGRRFLGLCIKDQFGWYLIPDDLSLKISSIPASSRVEAVEAVFRFEKEAQE